MLIKILSFIASVMSNARYKAVLIPCIVLALAVTSLTAVALIHDSSSRQGAASTTGNTGESTSDKPSSASPQINAGAQDPKSSTDQPVADGQSGNSGSGANPGSTSSQPDKPASGAVDVAVSSATITVEPDGSSNAVTAAVSDNTPLVWSITPESNETAGLQVVIEKPKETAATFSFRFRASQNAAPGQYQFTLTAKDTARGINVSKTILVTVTS